MSKGKTIDINKLALWHHVASIPYLGPVRFQKLFTSLHGDIGRIFELKASDLDSLTGIVTTQVKIGIELVREKREASLLFAKAQTAIAQEVGARILLLDDPEYPEFLHRSKMCHPIVYCMGALDKFRSYDKAIAIVGTRNPTEKSKSFAFSTAKTLAQRGWIVVSGMAKGIDMIAHEGALAGGGRTIAVLGCGVDKPYPKEALELYKQIRQTNLVISEFPFGSKPEELRLKKRNKTTVAFALGALAVQTSSKGGTMNAVRACYEQNKPVFTISGEGEEFTGNSQILKESGFEVDQQTAISTIEGVCKKWPVGYEDRIALRRQSLAAAKSSASE